jgi:hypothetical protein
MGVAATTGASRATAWAAAVLAVLCLPTLLLYERAAWHEWRELAPTAETAGLWATPRERDEWRQVRALVGGRRAAVLAHQGGGAELVVRDLDLAPATGWIYNKGIAGPVDVARKVDQISGVDAVILTHISRRVEPFLDSFPEFRAALAGFERTDVGEDFVVFRRPRH